MQSKVIASSSRPPMSLPKVQWQNYVVYIFFAVVLLFFGATIGDNGFLTVTNLYNIARTTAMAEVPAGVASAAMESDREFKEVQCRGCDA